VKDWSGDGKHFLTTAYELKKQPTKARLYLMNCDGTEAKALTDGTESVYSGRLSPDGSKLLYVAADTEQKEKGRSRKLFVLDSQTGKSRMVEQQPRGVEYLGFCWSPDGKRIAHIWRQVHEKKDTDQGTESALVVADADGRNPVTVATENASNTGVVTMTGVDWR
jgi:Tol biopolymer transport system component